MTDDDRNSLIDYIEFARDKLTELLSHPSFPETWSDKELSELANAADQLADTIALVQRRRADRIFLTQSGIDSGP